MPNHVTSHWTASDVESIDAAPQHCIPVIGPDDLFPSLPGLDVWDMWPLADIDGRTCEIEGAVIWFALASPIFPDPIERHGHARIRCLLQRGRCWSDRGTLFPDGYSPGSREWSGSAVFDAASGQVRIFFTAAGRRGEATPTVEQRLFVAEGRFSGSLDASPLFGGWDPPVEFVTSDDDIYMLVNQAHGEPGKLKAFRDPGFFRDPATGEQVVVFSASRKGSMHEMNGAIGLVRRQQGGHWELLPPLLDADGLTNELERPHIIHRDGHYYLFWSTQAHVFQPGGPTGPTGLYGAVADRFTGPYRLLNGSGLVAANPPQEPLQAYSWWVLDDLRVTSFTDYWGLQGRRLAEHPDLVRSQFGGMPAPFFRLRFQDDRAWIDTSG